MSNLTPSVERPFKTKALYGDPRYSDITIKYSGREFKAHKVIICTRCKYFERALAEDGGFKESGAEVIELNNDDPVALEATFRYIYTSELREACPRRWEIDHWSHLLEVMFVSDKYGLPSLSSAALELMQMGATPAADDVHIILKLLRRAAEFPTHGKQMKAIMLSICQVSLYDNFDDADFLQWLDDHDEIRHEIYKENIDWL